MVNLGRIHDDIARITCVLILGGQSMANLERIREDFARITCDSVDPWGFN